MNKNVIFSLFCTCSVWFSQWNTLYFLSFYMGFYVCALHRHISCHGQTTDYVCLIRFRKNSFLVTGSGSQYWLESVRWGSVFLLQAQLTQMWICCTCQSRAAKNQSLTPALFFLLLYFNLNNLFDSLIRFLFSSCAVHCIISRYQTSTIWKK